MASRDPFNIAGSPAVASIPCTECGNNMHCVRRTPMSLGEYQLFVCVTCGKHTDRMTDINQASDAAIQQEAEKLAGVKPNSA